MCDQTFITILRRNNRKHSDFRKYFDTVAIKYPEVADERNYKIRQSTCVQPTFCATRGDVM